MAKVHWVKLDFNDFYRQVESRSDEELVKWTRSLAHSLFFGSDRNPDAIDMLQEAAERNENHSTAGAKGAMVRWSKERNTANDDSKAISRANGEANAVANGINRTEQNRTEDNRTEQKKKRIFSRPTVEDITSYSNEKSLGIDASQFFDYYSANGWRVGRNPMTDWKAAARNWVRRDYGKKKSSNYEDAKLFLTTGTLRLEAQ